MPPTSGRAATWISGSGQEAWEAGKTVVEWRVGEEVDLIFSMGSFLEGTVEEEEEGMAARCEWSVAKEGKRKGKGRGDVYAHAMERCVVTNLKRP
jgi:hypothetical protein